MRRCTHRLLVKSSITRFGTAVSASCVNTYFFCRDNFWLLLLCRHFNLCYLRGLACGCQAKKMLGVGLSCSPMHVYPLIVEWTSLIMIRNMSLSILCMHCWRPRHILLHIVWPRYTLCCVGLTYWLLWISPDGRTYSVSECVWQRSLICSSILCKINDDTFSCIFSFRLPMWLRSCAFTVCPNWSAPVILLPSAQIFVSIPPPLSRSVTLRFNMRIVCSNSRFLDSMCEMYVSLLVRSASVVLFWPYQAKQ